MDGTSDGASVWCQPNDVAGALLRRRLPDFKSFLEAGGPLDTCTLTEFRSPVADLSHYGKTGAIHQQLAAVRE
jgi:hypothetical protein